MERGLLVREAGGQEGAESFQAIYYSFCAECGSIDKLMT